MTIYSKRTLTLNAKNQYIFTLLNGEALRKFETLCVHIGNTNIKYLNWTLLYLGTYSTPINALSKQNRVIRHGIRNPREFKVRQCASHMTKIN